MAATDEDKIAKWDILGPEDEVRPPTPGVGEIWVNAQFERVPGQVDANDVLKPGTIVIVDVEVDAVVSEGVV